MRLGLRCAGCPDFEVELEPSATVADVKVAATAGCDIDPEAMRIIFRGKILKDDDATLEASGVDGKEALHVARGKPSAKAAPLAEPSATGSAAAPTLVDAVAATSVNDLSLNLKGPNGVEQVLHMRAAESVESVRRRAAEICGFQDTQIHVMHKGKILKDGVALSACGVKSDDVLRVVPKAIQEPSASVQAAATAAEPSMSETGPMPMAWDSGIDLSALLGHAGQQEAIRIIEGLGMTGASPEQLAAAVAAGRQGGQARRQAPGAGIIREEARERLDREVRLMERQVRILVRQRLRAGGNDLEAQRALAQAQFDEAQGVEEDAEVDEELLGEIARTMAEARARGAPVPNAARFVDRALARAQQARVLQERLRREAGDIDPDLEDAVAAAERSVAAAARAPRRLGGGGDVYGGGGGRGGGGRPT
mmetsp:Transcript_14257/g.39339  ORF Transcript_14257/g.39339 Transcript_14257/m.39339 type:complete len:423 (+) Transcript_14257:88-1356(+)